MNYDPFQTNALGLNYGNVNPMGSPYLGQQANLNPAVGNPAAALNALAASYGLSGNIQNGGMSQIGQPAYQGFANQGGVGLQQSPLAALLASQAAIQQLIGLSQTGIGLQNPQLAVALNNALMNNNALVNQILAASGLAGGQQFGYQNQGVLGQIGQAGSPYSQQLGAAGLGQQYGHQTIAGYGQQIGSPFGQSNSPFGQVAPQLAPQSWIGQAGLLGVGAQFTPNNPWLSQLAPRQFQGLGLSPWGQ